MVNNNTTSILLAPEVSSNRLSEPTNKPKEENTKGPDSFVNNLDTAMKRTEKSKPHLEPLQKMNQQPTSEKVTDSKVPDDTTGVMNQSYERTVVSYPVKRIAKDAVDDETKETLQDDNLWNLPTFVMAQPTNQVLVMAKKVEEAETSSIPVAKPVAQFMASIENELGVTPDRLVKAIRNLPPGALQESPEKTMPLVIANLGLQAEDEIKAMRLYTQMLNQMANLDSKDKVPLLPPTLAPAPVLAGPVAVSQVKASSIQEAAQIEPQKPQPVEPRQAVQETGKVNVPKVVSTKSNVPDSVEVRDQVKVKESVVQPKIQPAEQRSVSSASVEKPSLKASASEAPMSAAAPTGASAPQQESVASLPVLGSATPDRQSNDQDGSRQFFQQNGGGQNNPYAVKPEAGKSFDVGAVKTEIKSKAGLKAEELNSASISQVPTSSHELSTVAPDAKVIGAPVGVGGTDALGPKAPVTAKHEAIQSIIQNAQMLAQKGGGEMRMSLKPEHLGELHLHVALEGQRVNVQMMTERSDVKKLIEQSVSDLKHGLASHNLSMDKLNVTVSDKNTGSFQHGRPDFAAARDFAQQFQQQNQARREASEFEIPGVIDRPTVPRNVPAWGTSAMANLRPSQGAGRLDVVA